MKADVVDTKNKKVGEVELDDSVFGASVRPHLFWETVKAQMASRRAGTHSTKTATTVSGTGKKPFRQKGTGRARQGSSRGPHMRGGSVVHGPHPRDYSYRIPKKMVASALRSALSLRLSEAKLYVVKGWKPEKPRTQIALSVLANFKAEKALVVDVNNNVNLAKSIRNLKNAKFLPVEALNVYDLLRYDHLFLSDEAVEHVIKRLKTKPSRTEQALKAAGTAAKPVKKAAAKKKVTAKKKGGAHA